MIDKICPTLARIRTHDIRKRANALPWRCKSGSAYTSHRPFTSTRIPPRWFSSWCQTYSYPTKLSSDLRWPFSNRFPISKDQLEDTSCRKRRLPPYSVVICCLSNLVSYWQTGDAEARQAALVHAIGIFLRYYQGKPLPSHLIKRFRFAWVEMD